MVMSVTCSMHSALGNSLGSRNSDINEKKATWPANAKMMLVTARKAGAKLGEYAAARRRFGFGSIPRAIIVIRTAAQIEANAVPSQSCSVETMGEVLQAMLRYDTFFNVLGSVPTHSTTRATTPQTMLQVARSVMAFMAIVKVKMWLPMAKIKKMVCAAPPNSLPNGPHMTSRASAML
jgi:hypothetical protein